MFADLPGLDRHWRGAGMTLQALRIGKARAVVTDFCEEPRRQLGARSWQGAKKIVVGMTRKERFDGGAIAR